MMVYIRRHVVGITTVALFALGFGAIWVTGPSSIPHLMDNLIAGYLLAWGLYAMLSNLPRKEIGTRFIVMTMTIGACFMLAEATAVFRFIDYRAVFGTFDRQNSLAGAGRVFDRELLWLHEPYYHFEADYQGNLGRALCFPQDPSQRVTVQYDRNGFRNPADLDRADIVVLGDSYIEAPMILDKALSTTVLGRLQGRPVANLGNSGYGPQQELAVLKRFGLPLRPEVVVWAFFEGNDLSNMEEYHGKAARVAGAHAVWQDFWFRSLSRNLLALYFRSKQECVPNVRMQEFRAEFSDENNSSSPVFFAPTEVVSYPEETVREAQSYFREAYELCRDRGIRFMVVFVPEKYRVYHDLSNVRLSTDELRSWTVNDLPRLLRRLLAELSPDIEYVDLTPALKAASRNGIATYLSDDTHWTVEGHRVAAEAIHRALAGGNAKQGRRNL